MCCANSSHSLSDDCLQITSQEDVYKIKIKGLAFPVEEDKNYFMLKSCSCFILKNKNKKQTVMHRFDANTVSISYIIGKRWSSIGRRTEP